MTDYRQLLDYKVNDKEIRHNVEASPAGRMIEHYTIVKGTLRDARKLIAKLKSEGYTIRFSAALHIYGSGALIRAYKS